MSFDYPFTRSGNSATIFVNGVPRPVQEGHPNYDAIMDLIRDNEAIDADDLMKMIDTRQALPDALQSLGRVKVGYEVILLDDVPVHNALTRRMLEMVEKGFDVAPMAKFLENLFDNPSKTAVDELYLWLEQSNLPITPDGHFLAYKKVDDDYSSFHPAPDGSKVYNRIGDMVHMPRNQVDEDRNRTCSTGLHFCSFQYLPAYHGNRGKVLVLKVNPADVVAIPSDYNNAKGRAYKYKVISEVAEKDAEFAFPDPVYADDGDYLDPDLSQMTPYYMDENGDMYDMNGDPV